MSERKHANLKDSLTPKTKRYRNDSEICDSRYSEFVSLRTNAAKKHCELKSDTINNQNNAIRCTTPNCSCDCFAPGKTQMRICANCNHGWISHAMDKLGFGYLYHSHATIENLQSNTAYDISSLVLYGTHALPVRLKILLDRILCTLDQDELLHLLQAFGWTYEDYSRGYLLQDYCGNMLSRWSMMTKEEELLVIQLFLKFSETKNIAQNFLQDSTHCSIEQIIANSSAIYNVRKDSDFRAQKLVSNDRSNKTFTSTIRQCSNYKHDKHGNHGNSSDNDLISGHNDNMVTTKSDICQNSMSSSSVLQPISPIEKNLSPVNSHSPLSLSPLNKLQNMQPFDYRKNDNISKKLQNTSDIAIMSYTQNTCTPSSSPTMSTFSLIPNSTQPLVSTSISSNHVSSISTNMTSTTNSDVSCSDLVSEDDTNMSGGAINLSQTSSAYALKKVKHLRKSANPMKRRWNPMVLSGLTTNPSTGKKRVQCHVCLKTFCDKGALKIHFSAVHLREMHKCTVDGCNMMFSSRRSRNRHSANPNPKLHTPNFRRKVNPHDGRTANPYPLLASNSSPNVLNLSANSLIGSNIKNNISEKEHINVELAHTSSKVNLKLDNDGDDNGNDGNQYSPTSSCHTPDTESLSAMPQLSKSIVNKVESSKYKNVSEEGMNLSLKDERINSKGVRKRKSLNPTKCAPSAPLSINTSDDDMQYITSDDESSSDTYIDRVDVDVDGDDNDGNGDDDRHHNINDESKSEDYDSNDSIVLPKPQTNNNDINSNTKINDGMSKHMHILEYDIDGTIDLRKKPVPTPILTEEKKHIIRSDASFVSQMSTTLTTNESSMENPLRHLESLSLGSFTNLVSPRNQRSSVPSALFSSAAQTHPTHSLSYHAPGLGMCLTPSTPPSHIMPINKSNEKESNLAKESEFGNYSGSGNAIASGIDIDSCIADQVSLLPVFRDASFVGSVDVPVDKENPRRCTACGKIFQNHFGVKTHYQNVHLKLMHKCTVDGCNASFPSKRSRDRHSANLNLHRKLLSTHTENKSPFNLEKASASAMFPFQCHTATSLRDDIFSRLYDPQGLPLSLGDLYSRLPPLSADGLFAASAAAAAAASFPVVPAFHPAMCLPPPPPPLASSSLFLETRSCISRESPNSTRTTPSPSLSSRSSPPKTFRLRSPSTEFIFDASVTAADESGRYVCVFCHNCKADAIALKQHYEQLHRDLLHKCCIRGCNRVFLDKKTKKRHISFHNFANKEESAL